MSSTGLAYTLSTLRTIYTSIPSFKTGSIILSSTFSLGRIPLSSFYLPSVTTLPSLRIPLASIPLPGSSRSIPDVIASKTIHASLLVPIGTSMSFYVLLTSLICFIGFFRSRLRSSTFGTSIMSR